MKKIELEAKAQRKKRFTLLSSLTVGATILLALFQIILSNHLAGFGRELQTLASEEKKVSSENELLQKEIAKESALATISQKAHNLSLVAPSRFLVVEESEFVALGHSNGF